MSDGPVFTEEGARHRIETLLAERHAVDLRAVDLRAELASLRADRDAWKAKAEKLEVALRNFVDPDFEGDAPQIANGLLHALSKT